MKFQLVELRNMAPALHKLSDKELPLKISFRLSKFIKRVTEELKAVEEQRIKLVEKFGQKDEVKKMTRVMTDKEEEFNKAFGDFLQEFCEVDMDPIKIGEIENIRFSSSDLIKLEKIIVQ